jgi:GPH family glycoside/pentoside/hexuronide:cation symporter
MDAAPGLVASIPGIAFPVFWPKLKKIFGKKGFFHLFLAMFIVGELLTYVCHAKDARRPVAGLHRHLY